MLRLTPASARAYLIELYVTYFLAHYGTSKKQRNTRGSIALTMTDRAAIALNLTIILYPQETKSIYNFRILKVTRQKVAS